MSGIGEGYRSKSGLVNLLRNQSCNPANADAKALNNFALFFHDLVERAIRILRVSGDLIFRRLSGVGTIIDPD